MYFKILQYALFSVFITLSFVGIFAIGLAGHRYKEYVVEPQLLSEKNVPSPSDRTALQNVLEAENTHASSSREKPKPEQEKTAINPHTSVAPKTLSSTTIAISPTQSPAVRPLPSSGKELKPVTEEECEKIKTDSNFFLDPSMQALRVEKELRSNGNNADADLLRNISCHPQAVWFVGGNAENVKARARALTKAASEQRKILVLVLYNVPDHFTLTWRSGIGDAGEYRAWISAIAEGIGTSSPWILLEPDSIGLAFNLNNSDRSIRLNQIREAVLIFREKTPNARIYLDAGHSAWHKAADYALYLKQAGIENAFGFSTNVSNFQLLSNEISYGKQISELTGSAHFIIDTARNGNGPSIKEWCNPFGRALGKNPTQDTGNSLIDALLWIKLPGESDGTCNNGPSAGKFWTEYALELIRNVK